MFFTSYLLLLQPRSTMAKKENHNKTPITAKGIAANLFPRQARYSSNAHEHRAYKPAIKECCHICCKAQWARQKLEQNALREQGRLQ